MKDKLGPNWWELVPFIDHALLTGEANAEVHRVCDEAKAYRFATVCVRFLWLPLVARLLAGSGVKPICAVGFPNGKVPTRFKVDETGLAIAAGAQEIDMVINLDLLRANGKFPDVVADVEAVVQAARGRPVKVILETHKLDDYRIRLGCMAARQAGARFVQTCTGFTGSGDTEHAVRLMRDVVGLDDMGVKAACVYEDAGRMIAAGATRIGTSASVVIVTGRTGAGS